MSDNHNWQNNAIQFPRLIAELESVGAFPPNIINALADEMDLSPDEVLELVGRAQMEWYPIPSTL
jgi:hypothetical protein